MEDEDIQTNYIYICCATDITYISRPTNGDNIRYKYNTSI